MPIPSCCTCSATRTTAIYGQYIWELGVFKDIAASKEAFKTLQDSEYIRYDDLPLETLDGRPIAVEFVSNVYLVDHSKVIQCNIRDITQRKWADAERKRLMAAIEQVGEVIVMTDALGVIQFVNPAFERATGYSRAEAVGQNPRILKSGEQDEPFYRDLWRDHHRRRGLGGPHGQSAEGRDPLHRGGDDLAGPRPVGPDRQLRLGPTGHDGAPPADGPDPAGPEDGSGGPAGGRGGPRLQQHAQRDPRLCGSGPDHGGPRPTAARATSRRSTRPRCGPRTSPGSCWHSPASRRSCPWCST